MKTNLLLLNRTFLLGAAFLLSSLIGVSQNVNIPDANFKVALVGNASINTNGDTEIQTAEAATFAGEINVYGLSISDLTGIEAFTALTYLQCDANLLTSLNVSANTALTDLWCVGNQLTSLNVSANTALFKLDCSYNQLTSLDVSANTTLNYLLCPNNQLTSLNVSANTALTNLACANNQLTSLNVSANAALMYLYCRNNQLTSLNFSANTALIYLYCFNNQLTSLNVPANTTLNYLSCFNNQLTSLNVSGASALTDLICANNQLTSLDVSANTTLNYLACVGNQLTSLDVSANTALAYLYCGNNQLTSLNVQNGNNTNFEVFVASINPNLICIQVDDEAWSTANWTVADGEIDAIASFSVACGVLGVDEQNTFTFTIYPNPSNEQLFIELTDYKNTIAEIFNLQGQLLQSIPLQSSKTTIQISNLTSGSYLFKVKSPKGTIVKKIVKN